jgi:hypothetical protein
VTNGSDGISGKSRMFIEGLAGGFVMRRKMTISWRRPSDENNYHYTESHFFQSRRLGPASGKCCRCVRFARLTQTSRELEV